MVDEISKIRLILSDLEACESLTVVVKIVWSGRVPVWLGESVGGSPEVSEAEVMLRFAMEEGRHHLLLGLGLLF